jgi:hypothetical protein
MNRIRVRNGVMVGTIATFLIAVASPQATADASQAPAPNPEVVTQTTNAMLQPSDVPAVLGRASGVDAGYGIPPGGQDPQPICYEPGEFAVIPVLDNATGYFSASDQVTQEIYVYPSAQSAQSAWSVLNRQITSKCTFVDVDGKNRIRSRQGELASGAGRWVRMDMTNPDASSFYSAVGLVDNGIVIARFQGKQGLTQTTSEQRAAIDALFAVLTKRYADRATLGQLQPAAVTSAQQALLQPGDMPAALPILQPANGAWADQRAQVPGQSPFNGCNPRKDLLPAGTGSFSQSLGSTGDVFAKTGMVFQQVFTYESADRAQAAWTTLNRTIKDCNKAEGTLYAKGANYKTVTGTADVSGSPGLFVRDTDTQNFGKGSRFVTKAYTVYTLDGNAIISVDYARSRMGMTRFSIDEAAVRDLTAFAASKWAQTTS